LRAFTLLEMMVVVAILGVFFALAVPVLTPEVHKAQLDGASDVVASFVARARSQAMESKRCTRVFLNTTATPNIIVAERLNNFDCDTAPQTLPGGLGIDGTNQVWIEFARYTMPAPSVTISTFQQPGELTGACIGCVADGAVGYPAANREIRFRPNGRIWTNVTSMAATATCTDCDDDAVLQVDHIRLGSFRRILINSNGLICRYQRDALMSPAAAPPQDYVCP